MNDAQLIKALRALDGPAQPDSAFAQTLLDRLERQRAESLAQRRLLGRPVILSPTLRLGLATALLLAALLGSALAAGALIRLLPVTPPSILYVPGGGGLYVAEGDYRQPRRLRDDGAYFVPRASGSGRYVATTYVNHDGLNELRILTSAGVYVGRFLYGADAPAWSPVSDELAVLNLSITNEVQILAPDGSVLRSFTPPEGVRFGRPSWSPDGTRLTVGVRSHNGQTEGVWLIDVRNGRTQHLIETAGGEILSFRWSPSGRHIAFATLKSGSQSGTVWISAPDGSERLEVGSTSFRSWLLDWSPGGDRMVFSSLVDGQSELFSVRADGSQLRRLTNDPADDLNPAWSPDGRTIAFERAGRDGSPQATWVMNTDGSDQRHVFDEWVGPGWGILPSEPAEAEPLTGVFVPGPTLAAGRSGHTLSAAQGSVLIAGGVDGQASTSVERTVLSSSEAEAAGQLLEARVHHSATALSDGRTLIVGGLGRGGDQDWLASAELFDPVSGSSSATGSLIEARAHHSAALLPDGRVLVFGGTGASNDVPATPVIPLGTAEVWDPGTESFTPAGEMFPGPGTHSATSLSDGRVLVITHEQAYIWDPTGNSLRAIEGPSEQRQHHTATLLTDGRVLLVGGSDGAGALASAAVFDPVTENFRTIAPLNEPRDSHTATLLTDGRVLIAGGDTGGPGPQPLASAELWDPASETFDLTGSLVQARTGHTALLLWSDEPLVEDRRVLVAGGVGSDGIPLPDVELFYTFAR